MRQGWIIYTEEMARLMRSATTYTLLAFFYLLNAAMMLAVFSAASSEPQTDNPFKTFWQLQWLGNVVLVPLLTMRMISQERKAGLLEAILATPTTPFSVVCGKFFAAYTLYLMAWACVPVYMAVVSFVGLSPADTGYLFDASAMVGGGIFCVVSGLSLVALGVWTSSLTRNGWLSGALTACLMLLWMMLPTVASGAGLTRIPEGVNYLETLADFSDGRIMTGNIVGSVLLGILLLSGASLAIEKGAD